jgi:hypothetical protein
MATDSESSVRAERDRAALLAAFSPVVRLLEVRASLGVALARSVGEASDAVIAHLYAAEDLPATLDPDEAWEKFLEDLDSTFEKAEELAGSNAGKCVGRWQEQLGNFGREWRTVTDGEQRGVLSHQAAAAERQRITTSMKIAGDTYMRCLNQPIRKQVVPE